MGRAYAGKKAGETYRRGTTSLQDRQRGGGGENRARPAYYPPTYRALTAAKLRGGGIPTKTGKPRRLHTAQEVGYRG